MDTIQMEREELLQREQVLGRCRYYWSLRRFQDIVLSAAATALTWTGWICILPFIGMILTTFALRARTSGAIRLLNLPNDPLWLIYNAMSGSISGVITEVCIICSILIGMLRHDVPQLREKIRAKKQK